MTVTGIYSMSLGLGIQGAILLIGMGWITVLLLVLGFLGRVGSHQTKPASVAKASGEN
jgi:hypothetical protein